MLDVDISYPTSDGKPMGETDAHREQIIDLIKALEYYYQDDPQVYVSGNILMFYEQGNRKKHRSPDVLVARGVEKKERENYKLWEEPKAPDVVFEITSRSTRTEDLGEKRGLYALLGIQEYVIFDPLDEYLEPKLKLYRLRGEGYEQVTGTPLRLETLGLELLEQNGKLRLRDTSRNRILLTPEERAEEESKRADEESQKAQKEARRAEEEARRAEEEARRAEEAARRAEEEARRAKEESLRAEKELRRANSEAERAERAEAELVRLRARLAELGEDADR